MIPDPTAILALTLVQKAEAHTLFTIPLGGYELHVTQHMFMALMSCILVLLVFLPISRRIAVKGASVEDHVTRGRVSQLFESILVFLRENVARPNLGHLTDKYIYYIWTVFFVVLFANLLGLAPGGQTTVSSDDPDTVAASDATVTPVSPNVAPNGEIFLPIVTRE